MSICTSTVHVCEKPSVFVPVREIVYKETNGLLGVSFAEAGSRLVSQKIENEGSDASNVIVESIPELLVVKVHVSGQSALFTLEKSIGKAVSVIVYSCSGREGQGLLLQG